VSRRSISQKSEPVSASQKRLKKPSKAWVPAVFSSMLGLTPAWAEAATGMKRSKATNTAMGGECRRPGMNRRSRGRNGHRDMMLTS
jgi:hypothetical protein